MTTTDRVFQLMKENNLNAKEFAEIIGVSQGNITDWKKERSKPSVKSLQKIAQYFNVQLDWLTGDSEYKTLGEDFEDYTINQNKILILKTIDRYYSEYVVPCTLTEKDIDLIVSLLSNVNLQNVNEKKIEIDKYINSFNEVKKKKIREFFNIIIRELIDDITAKSTFYYFASLLDEEANNSNPIFSRKLFNIPIYGKISAGIPNWAEECLDGYLPIDPNLMNIVDPEECFFLRVNGESMNKMVRNGAYALIRKQDFIDDGEIAVVLVDGLEATLKKFTKQGDFVLLEPMSNDPSFTTQIYDKNTEIKILGKYIGKFEIN